MLVVAVFLVSTGLRSEAGLLGVTVMGIALANQRWYPVRHIIEFKENLRVLIISSLFILLAARMRAEDLERWLAARDLLIALIVSCGRWRSGFRAWGPS